MLGSFRSYSQSPGGRFLLALMFGLLAVSFFIAFGPSGRLFEPTKGADYAAKVNGEVISRVEFERYYYRQVRQFGTSVDQAMLDRYMPRSRVLDELIKDRLLSEAALNAGIDASDHELASLIRQDPSFQDEDGKFSAERYQLVLRRQLGLSVDMYEDQVRRDLRGQKMANLLRENAKVTDAELARKYREENDKVNLRFVRFSPAFYSSQIVIGDDEAKAFLKDHMDQVQAAYTKQSSIYHVGKQVQARHILIKTKPGDDAAALIAKGRLDKLKADIEKGADFAGLAKSQSQAGDAASGGELGMVKQGGHLFDPAIETAALALAEGKVSDPFQTKQGWELIQAEKIFPAQDHPLDEVKENVARNLILKDRSSAKAESEAKAAQAALALGKSMEELFPPAPPPAGGKAAPNLAPDHPVSDTTGAFAQSGTGFVPKIGPAAELQKAAFDARLELPTPAAGDSEDAAPGAPFKLLPGPTSAAEAFVVAEVIEHDRADMSAFAKEKDELRDGELRQQENQMMQNLRQKLRAQAVVEINNAVLGPAQGT